MKFNYYIYLLLFLNCNKVKKIPFLLDYQNVKLLTFEKPDDSNDTIFLLKKTNQFNFVDKNGIGYERYSIFFKSKYNDSSPKHLFYAPFLDENKNYCFSLEFSLKSYNQKSVNFSIEFNTNINYQKIEKNSELLFLLNNEIDSSIIEKVLWNTKKGPVIYWYKKDSKSYLINNSTIVGF